MSSIITNTILTTYPIAGVDNDSQGFRDNFLRIKTALDQAKSELERFETHAVLKGTLDNNNTSVENNINGSSIINGKYNKFYGSSLDGGVITGDVITVNLNSGISQYFVASITGTTLTFTNWPTLANTYASVRVHISVVPTNANGVDITSFTSENNGIVIKENGFPTTLHADKDSYIVVEAWTQGLLPPSNAHPTIFIKYLGKYSKV